MKYDLIKRLRDPVFRAAGLALVLLIAVNLCAAQLSGRLGLRLDMTGSRLYTLSDTTLQVLDGLREPVEIRVFSSEADFLPLVGEVLRRYGRADGITVSYIDPYENPATVDAYIQRGLEVTQGTVVVEGRYRARAVQLEEMFTLDEAGQTVQSLNCEQRLTSAVLYVQSGSSPLVQFTAGHNEHISQGLTGLFSAANSRVETLSLAVADPDPEAGLLVIASPTADFTPRRRPSWTAIWPWAGGCSSLRAPPAPPCPTCRPSWPNGALPSPGWSWPKRSSTPMQTP